MAAGSSPVLGDTAKVVVPGMGSCFKGADSSRALKTRGLRDPQTGQGLFFGKFLAQLQGDYSSVCISSIFEGSGACHLGVRNLVSRLSWAEGAHLLAEALSGRL